MPKNLPSSQKLRKKFTITEDVFMELDVLVVLVYRKPG